MEKKKTVVKTVKKVGIKKPSTKKKVVSKKKCY